MRGPCWPLEGSISNIWGYMIRIHSLKLLEQFSPAHRCGESARKGVSINRSVQGALGGKRSTGGSNCKPDPPPPLATRCLTYSLFAVDAEVRSGALEVKSKEREREREREQACVPGSTRRSSCRRESKRQKKETEKNQSEAEGWKKLTLLSSPGEESRGLFFPRFDFDRSPLLRPSLSDFCRHQGKAEVDR